MCFIGITALWLATAGDRAEAETEWNLSTRSVTRSHDAPVALGPGTSSRTVTFEQTDDLVQHLSVYVNLAATQVSGVKLYLTSPSGTRVQLVDGARTRKARADGLEGWFGFNGRQTSESLAAFAGEPLTGAWTLSVNSSRATRLVRWSITAGIGPSMYLASSDTCDPYNGCPGPVGCCNGRGEGGRAMAGLGIMFAVGILCTRRRSDRRG